MTTTISHEQARHWILERQLAPEAAPGLERHLSACLACRTYAEQVARGLAAFRSLPVAADADLVPRTRARLRRAAAHPPREAMSQVVLSAASLAACSGLLVWGLLTQRCAAWCQDAFGLSASVALLLATLVWLWPSALAAVALFVADTRRDAAALEAEWRLPSLAGGGE